MTQNNNEELFDKVQVIEFDDLPVQVQEEYMLIEFMKKMKFPPK